MKLDFGRTADRIYINAKKSVTLMGRAGGGGGKTGLYLLPVYTIAGNVIGRDAKHGGNQLGINQDVAPTLTSTDRHAVAYEVYNRDQEAEACRIMRTGHMGENSIRRVSGIAEDEKLDVIPCNYFMELAELAVKADQDHAQHDRYKTALGEAAGEYDYCIIDNPPDLGMNVITGTQTGKRKPPCSMPGK